MSLLKAIQGQAQASTATNIVNGDIKVVEDVDGSDGRKTIVHADTTPQGPSARPKFRPVDRSAIVQAMPEDNGAKPPSDNFDLVGDDIGASPAQRQNAAAAGRPRLYPSNADRQRAYRNRQKQNG